MRMAKKVVSVVVMILSALMLVVMLAGWRPLAVEEAVV